MLKAFTYIWEMVKKTSKLSSFNKNFNLQPKPCHGTPLQGPLQESPVLSRILRVQLMSATRRYITSLRPRPLRSIAQRLVDSSNTYALQPLPPSRDITLRLFITDTQPIINSIFLQYCRHCQKQHTYKLPYFILLKNPQQ